MKIKKGFLKNNWPTMIVVLVAIAISITSRDTLIVILTIVFVLTLAMKYKMYDEMVQEADDWWNGMSKEDKQKLKDNGIKQ